MPAQPLLVNDLITIPGDELELRFSRSSGAGGQNVNKVNSRVELRFMLEASTAIPPATKDRLRALARKRLTQDGELVLTSQRFRDQARNIGDCYAKLRELIMVANEAPRERQDTSPTRGSVARRLAAKHQRAKIKQTRKARETDDS